MRRAMEQRMVTEWRTAFNAWLLAQTHRDDSAGDIARDAAADACWDGRESLGKHMARMHDAQYEAISAYSRALREFGQAYDDALAIEPLSRL